MTTHQPSPSTLDGYRYRRWGPPYEGTARCGVTRRYRMREVTNRYAGSAKGSMRQRAASSRSSFEPLRRGASRTI